ncbi:hypothetical protein J6W78_06025 [bacterium]|nr:hypothetical protein [bacterium]
MKNTKFLVLFLIVFLSFAVFAQENTDPENQDPENQDPVTTDPETPDPDTEVPDDEDTGSNNKGHMIGGDPVMSWEDGGQDFFVMFNSNVDDKIKLPDDDENNPQGDTCVDSSSFTLNNLHIPDDAIIEKAYLIWMGAVDPEKLSLPTDNEVRLAFTQTADKNVEYAEDVKVGEAGEKLSAAPSFDFEGIRFKQNVTLGCTTDNIKNTEMEIGYFTYRVDITKFFNEIYEINKTAGHQEGTGEYYGTYTFSGLDCTEHDAYRCNTTMLSGWSIFFIYRSKNIRPKKIYFYNGLSHVYNEESVAKVSGFELPLNPAVRLTTMVGEGDPSLTNNNPPFEGLFLKGQNADGIYKLKNKCNPITGTYVEVFNSISSIVNWNQDAPEDEKIICVSGPNDEGVNYGIDVDTFLLDSEKEINLQEHLEKGNTSMEIKLSVNQDAIVTNFMVLSVDIKGSDFDIPDEPEKYFCACPASDNNTVNDYYCPYVNRSKEFYYLVKVQNWGKDETKAVSISDELDTQLDYIPGTTEYATKFNDKGDGTDWTVIPDKDGNKFPLSGDGVKLADKMSPCDKNYCPDKILVRYKVRPKTGIAKNYVFSNIAEIKDAKSETPYKTNTSYPLKLKPGSCVPDAQCVSPTPEMCGGVKDNRECGDEGLPNCGKGYTCEDYKCKDDLTLMCNDAQVKLALGKNSPQSENTIIIPKDNGGQPLVLGQFTLQASDCDEEKVFNFNDFSIHFDTKNNSKFEFSDFELIYDADGNGVYDENGKEDENGRKDEIISNPDATTKNLNYIYFSLKSDAKKFVGKSLNYFIVRAKVNYNDDMIPTNTAFNFFIQSVASVNVSSNGTSNISNANGKNDSSIDFATFYLEPTGDYFIVTSGSHDPSVPAISEMNNDIPVMQIKTKSIGKPNSIKKFKIKVSGSSVKFGDKNGITGISLWLDTNNDGSPDVELAKKTNFSSGESSAITFEESDFSQPLTYTADEVKYLVVKVDFNMTKTDPPMFGKVIIPKGGISLGDNTASVYELPLNSKQFTYDCPEGDSSCETEKKKSGGCAVLEVESDNTGIIVIAAVLSAAAMLGFALLRKKIF